MTERCRKKKQKKQEEQAANTQKKNEEQAVSLLQNEIDKNEKQKAAAVRVEQSLYKEIDKLKTKIPATCLPNDTYHIEGDNDLVEQLLKQLQRTKTKVQAISYVRSQLDTHDRCTSMPDFEDTEQKQTRIRCRAANLLAPRMKNASEIDKLNWSSTGDDVKRSQQLDDSKDLHAMLFAIS